jgi:hypothetical protein
VKGPAVFQNQSNPGLVETNHGGQSPHDITNHLINGAHESTNIIVLIEYGKCFSRTKNLFSRAKFAPFLDSYTGKKFEDGDLSTRTIFA